jgi:hypothetical protein
MVEQSSDGDTIDCVDISQQPAFDHPFLKDHKIQVRTTHQCVSMLLFFYNLNYKLLINLLVWLLY